jgi:acetyl-CoA acetyltransferase
VHVVGLATTAFAPEHNAMLDELVFDVVYRALREAGLRKQDIGLTVTASLDVFDGRSISAGLTAMASGGYLVDGYRVEADSGVAVIRAAEAVAAGDVDVAVAVGVHNPEHRSGARASADFLETLSNLAFEPHAARPLGFTAELTLGMHADNVLGTGSTTLDDLARSAASEISLGAASGRSVRTASRAVTAADVLASPLIVGPLRELMLPAYAAGAAAVVLASPARAGRCVGRSVRLNGFGHATGAPAGDTAWWRTPGAPTARAVNQALRQTAWTEPSIGIDIVELSGPTPALLPLYRLALTDRCGSDCAAENRRGGLLSCYAGVANGIVRLVEAVDQVEPVGRGGRLLSHSVDLITGLVAQDVTVLVGEAV